MRLSNRASRLQSPSPDCNAGGERGRSPAPAEVWSAKTRPAANGRRAVFSANPRTPHSAGSIRTRGRAIASSRCLRPGMSRLPDLPYDRTAGWSCLSNGEQALLLALSVTAALDPLPSAASNPPPPRGRRRRCPRSSSGPARRPPAPGSRSRGSRTRPGSEAPPR